jgi:hypothetical protein
MQMNELHVDVVADKVDKIKLTVINMERQIMHAVKVHSGMCSQPISMAA